MVKPIKDRLPASGIMKRQNWQSGKGKKDLIIHRMIYNNR